MKVIGITGPTGAGKTTALSALLTLGAALIDADAVYHELTVRSGAMRAEMEARFGAVFGADGMLDRKRLGSLVFQDERALADLNAITHAYVGDEVDRRLARAREEGRPAAAIDAIALIESGMGEKCDILVAVLASEEVRIRRIMAREGISEDYARLRVSAQKGADWFRARCDYVLESTETDTPEAFSARALALFRPLIEHG